MSYFVVSGLSDEELVLLTHGDSVESNEVAEDFKVIANSGNLVAGLSHFISFVCILHVCCVCLCMHIACASVCSMYSCVCVQCRDNYTFVTDLSLCQNKH